MFPLLISVTVSITLYCFLRILLSSSSKEQAEISARLADLKNERTDAVPVKKKVRRVRKKQKGASLARTRSQLKLLEDQLYDVGIRIPVQQFLALWAAVTLGLPLILALFRLNMLICILVAAVCAFAPFAFLNMRRKKRRTTLENQLIEAISILCNALRAGHSFQQAMNSIATEMDGPVAEEFGRVFRETQHGMTMEDSMARMLERTGSADLEMLCTAILIQREVGGNLAEVLENISGTIQSRLSLKAEIKTRTSSGRLSGYLVGALPILLLAAITFINPDYASKLFHTPAGHIMLAVSAVLEILGFVVIKKIVTIKY